MWEIVLGYLKHMGITEVVTLASMGAAWVAAHQAIRNTRIMVRIQQRSELAIDIYSVNHYVVRSAKDTDNLYYVFHLILTNASTGNNSVKKLELSLQFRQENQPLPNVIRPHNADSASKILDLNFEHLFRVPCSILAGDTISRIAVFPVEVSVINNRRSASCTVTVTDAHDREVRYESLIIRELEHEKTP